MKKLTKVGHWRRMLCLQSYITKERARASFDGSLWPILAEEQKAKKAQKKRAKAH